MNDQEHPKEDEGEGERRRRFLAAVNGGLADIEAGRTISDEELTRLIEEAFPLPRRSGRRG